MSRTARARTRSPTTQREAWPGSASARCSSGICTACSRARYCRRCKRTGIRLPVDHALCAIARIGYYGVGRARQPSRERGNTMGMFDNMKDKAGDLVDDHGDKVGEGLDKSGDFADEKTGGKYGDK